MPHHERRFRARPGRLLALAAALTATLSPPASALGTQETTPRPVQIRPFFAALSVADLERSIAWYGRVFGFSVSRRDALPGREIRVAILVREGALLEMVEDGASTSVTELDPALTPRARLRGLFKLGFQVDDLDEALGRLEALEVPLRGNVIAEADGSMRSAQIEDPDGTILQLFELLRQD